MNTEKYFHNLGVGKYFLGTKSINNTQEVVKLDFRKF